MVLKLIVGLVIILAGAEFFTNGIEWLGKKLNLSQGAVGSVLAAVGTALPESMIPIVAIFFGDGEAGEHIGVGAILGAPFMLGTLGLALIGFGALFFKRRRKTSSEVAVHRAHLQRDMAFFLVLYMLAVVAAFLPTWGKYLVVVALVGGYIWYVRLTLAGENEEISDCPPLYLARKSEEPPMGRVVAQVLLALALIVFGAKYFVGGVDLLAERLALSPLLVAMVLAPIATELPEKLNSIIWMRQNKDIMAIGNMTGAMVFQSSLLPAFGLVFTPWELEGLGIISAIMAIASAGILWLVNSRREGRIPGQLMLLFSGFYMIFAYLVLQEI